MLTTLGLNTDKRPDEPNKEGRTHGVMVTDFGGRLNVETPPAPALGCALR